MQKVLTINVPFTTPWALPYGPAVVNGLLQKANYETLAWDLSIDLYRQFHTHPEFESFSNAITINGYAGASVSKHFVTTAMRWVREQCRQRIDEYQPDIILLSIFSSQSLDFAIPLSTWLREIAPDAYIMIGGRGIDNIERQSKLNYAEFFLKYLPIDAAYMGDAENDLVRAVTERIQGCHVAPPVSGEELSTVPPANWEGIDFSKYDGYDTGELRVPIVASKGCVRECTFCDVAGSWPKFVFRKGAEVGEELVKIYEKTGMRKIEFTDNLVNGSISNFRAMNKVLAEKIPNTLDYLGNAICRPKNEMPESDFELASRAGARMFKVGIESGSEKIRHDMKKKFSNEDIDWFATNCAKYNIKQLWLMFVGYPSETEQDFQDTLDLLDKYSYLAKQGKIVVFLSLPMMLTTNSGFMRRYAIDYGLEHNREDSWSDFFWTSTKYKENTFEVRVDRWKRFMRKLEEGGYTNESMRQTQKFIELEGLEKIYKDIKDAKQKKIIPIIDSSIHINKETFV